MGEALEESFDVCTSLIKRWCGWELVERHRRLTGMITGWSTLEACSAHVLDWIPLCMQFPNYFGPSSKMTPR